MGGRLDTRKHKIVNDECHLHIGNPEKKFLRKNKDSPLRIRWSCPSKEHIREDGGLDIPTHYSHEPDKIWLDDIANAGNDYPNTLTKYLAKIKTIDPEVDQWLAEAMIPVSYKYPVGSIVLMKKRSDISKLSNAVGLIEEHNTDIGQTYPWHQSALRKYKCSHIDINVGLDEVAHDWVLMTDLNECKSDNGFRGDVCDNDIECIISDPHRYGRQIQLLQIQLYLKKKELFKFKMHSKATADNVMSKMSDRLYRWGSPAFVRDLPRSEEFYIPNNIKIKEFAFILSRKGGIEKNDWTTTSATETLVIEYNTSLSVFGTANIVKTYRPKNGRPSDVAKINLTLKYSKRRSMLKLECNVVQIYK